MDDVEVRRRLRAVLPRVVGARRRRPWSTRTSTTRPSSSTRSATRSWTSEPTPEWRGAAGSVDAIRSRDDTRLVTSGVQALFAVRDELGELFAAAGAEVDTETGVNTQMTADVRSHDDGDAQRPRRRANGRHATRRSTSPGTTTSRVRYDLDHELPPEPRDRRYREPSQSDRRQLAVHRVARSRDRRLHVDGLGLPRRSRHRTRRVAGRGERRRGSRGSWRAYPWLTAWCGDIDITGHRRPVSYYREIVFGLRDDAVPRRRATRPRRPDAGASAARGRGATRSRAGRGPATRASRCAVEVYGDADEVELLVNGRSVGRAPAGPTNRLPGLVRDDVRAGRARRGRVPGRR